MDALEVLNSFLLCAAFRIVFLSLYAPALNNGQILE